MSMSLPVLNVQITPEGEKIFREQRLAFEHCRRTVSKHWPQYWPFCEAILSAAATLRLKNVPAAIALFGVGDSGVGKNTVFKMFGWDLPHLIIWRDKFSLAALQSHHADETGKILSERALFRLAKHKLMVTPELGVLFRGRTYILEERFGELAQWLDGEGRITDSGTHGALGEKGDFTFVWTAGTTPFYLNTWETMAALGTRILFFEVLKGPYMPEDAFASALAECREAVNTFLNVLITEGTSCEAKECGVRASEWPVMDDTIAQTIHNYAVLLALGHGIRRNLGASDADIHFPSPNHFRSRLGILLRGEALVRGRMVVLSEDLPMAKWITQSSMPGRRGPVLLALLNGEQGVDDIVTATGLSPDTVRGNLKALVATGVVEELKSSVGVVGRPPLSYRLNAETFARML